MFQTPLGHGRCLEGALFFSTRIERLETIDLAEITLKKATTADVDCLREISITTFTDTFGDQNSPEDLANYLKQAYSVEQLTAELVAPLSVFYFAYLEGELAGYLKLNQGAAQTEDVGENALEVERIYILPTFERHGLGSRLIAQAEQVAHQLNKSEVWLGVWEKNFAAQHFYEHLGFHKIGEHTFMMGTDPQTDLMMMKTIA